MSPDWRRSPQVHSIFRGLHRLISLLASLPWVQGTSWDLGSCQLCNWGTYQIGEHHLVSLSCIQGECTDLSLQGGSVLCLGYLERPVTLPALQLRGQCLPAMVLTFYLGVIAGTGHIPACTHYTSRLGSPNVQGTEHCLEPIQPCLQGTIPCM